MDFKRKTTVTVFQELLPSAVIAIGNGRLSKEMEVHLFMYLIIYKCVYIFNNLFAYLIFHK